MFILSESFAMFTYSGVWLPISWESKSYKTYFYKLYTISAIILVYTLTISELVGAVVLAKNLQDFTDISFLLISTIGVCCKVANIIFKRKKVLGLSEMLLENYCIPKDQMEIDIVRKFDRIARYTALSCIILAETTVGVMSTGPLFQSSGNRTLPFKSWLPYEITSSPLFWLSYVHQSAAIIICATINVANDSLICGFMVLACSQLELLNSRLLRMPETAKMKISKETNNILVRKIEAEIISDHIQHHMHIFKFAENIRIIFTPIILIQFCMSSIVLSLSVYQLSMISTNGIQFITMVLYLCCMLVQFFMYCWFGNEVTLKSIEFGQALYEVDWTDLQVKTSKNMLLMMLRAKKPIVMTCGYLVTLSIQSFTTIVKTSYSAFNVLQRSEHGLDNS